MNKIIPMFLLIIMEVLENIINEHLVFKPTSCYPHMDKRYEIFSLQNSLVCISLFHIVEWNYLFTQYSPFYNLLQLEPFHSRTLGFQDCDFSSQTVIPKRWNAIWNIYFITFWAFWRQKKKIFREAKKQSHNKNKNKKQSI